MNIPATDSVKLEVLHSTRNSLTSMANAMNAPTEIRSHMSSTTELSVCRSVSSPSKIRLPEKGREERHEYCFESYDRSTSDTILPSNPIVNGSTAKIIHGCMW